MTTIFVDSLQFDVLVIAGALHISTSNAATATPDTQMIKLLSCNVVGTNAIGFNSNLEYFSVHVRFPSTTYAASTSTAYHTAGGVPIDVRQPINLATTPIQVSVVNGVIINTIGIPPSSATIGPSNATHMQVLIDLGTNTAGKRRRSQGFRVMSNGSERPLLLTERRVGEVYSFVFPETSVEGSTSVNLILN